MEWGCFLYGHDFKPLDTVNHKNYACTRCGQSIGQQVPEDASGIS